MLSGSLKVSVLKFRDEKNAIDYILKSCARDDADPERELLIVEKEITKALPEGGAKFATQPALKLLATLLNYAEIRLNIKDIRSDLHIGEAQFRKNLEHLRKALGDTEPFKIIAKAGRGAIKCNLIVGDEQSHSASPEPQAAPIVEVEAGKHPALQQSLEAFASCLRNEFRSVRPLSGLSLPDTDFSRESHYVERRLSHYLKTGDRVILITESTSAVLDRLNMPQTHIGLVALPGMGKSSLLEHLVFLSAAKLDSGSDHGPVPVLLRLGDVRTALDIRNQIDSQLFDRVEAPLRPEDVEGAELLLFVDGLDELMVDKVGPVRDIGTMLLDLIEHGITLRGTSMTVRSSIVSSRPEGIHLCNVLPHFRTSYAREAGEAPQILNLEPFNENERWKYVDQFFGSQSKPQTAFKEKLELLPNWHSDAAALDSPLLLFLLCFIGSAGAYVDELKLPETAAQILVLGLRRSLALRGSDLTEAHLQACAAIAFAHRLRGTATLEQAVQDVVAACQYDLNDPTTGLAAQLDIRQDQHLSSPSVRRAAASALVADVLCARTGLLRMTFGLVAPVNARIADLLVAYHLRQLARTFGFGFDSSTRRGDGSAGCIRDPNRIVPANETVAAAVSRWAWNSRWFTVIRDLAELLAEDRQAVPLIRMLATYSPIEGINPNGDDDGGHRLLLAVQCWESAKHAHSEEPFKMVRDELSLELSRRTLAHSLLDAASYRLTSQASSEYRTSSTSEGCGALSQMPPKGEDNATQQRILTLLHNGNLDQKLAFLRKNLSNEVADKLCAIAVGFKNGANTADGEMSELVDAIKRVEQDSTHPLTLGIFVRVLHSLGFSARLKPAFLCGLVERPAVAEDAPAHNRDLCHSTVKGLLEQELVYALEHPENIRVLFEIQSNRSLQLHSQVSDVFRGRLEVLSLWDRSPDPLFGRSLSPAFIRELAVYINTDESGFYWGTSPQDSALAFLTRMRPSAQSSDDALTGAICEIFRSGCFPVAGMILKKLRWLRQYKLKYAELYPLIKSCILEMSDGDPMDEPGFYVAALECLTRAMPLIDDDWLVAELQRFEHVPWKIARVFAPYGIDVVKRFGLFWRILGVDSAFVFREVGMDFIKENAAALCSDENFIPNLLAHKRTGLDNNVNDIVSDLAQTSGSSETARQILVRFASLNPKGVVDLIKSHPVSLFNVELRVWMDGENGPRIETVDQLTIGHHESLT
jgi:hypothetical protein